MKKLVLVIALLFGFMFLVAQTHVNADYSLPPAYNLTWSVSNPAAGLYEGYSQWVTIGSTPSNIIFFMTNRSSSTLPSYYRLVISSVTGGYTEEIDLLYTYNMNFIDWETITTRTFYSDTRYRFRVMSTSAGSLSGMSTYLEANSAVYNVSTLSAIMAYNDALSFEYGYNSGLESARSQLAVYDTETSTWLGYDDGYDIGYNDGYDIGVTEDLQVTSLWSGVISFIGSIFTLEIFPNVTLGLILSVFIGFYFIKWFLSVVRG